MSEHQFSHDPRCNDMARSIGYRVAREVAHRCETLEQSKHRPDADPVHSPQKSFGSMESHVDHESHKLGHTFDDDRGGLTQSESAKLKARLKEYDHRANGESCGLGDSCTVKGVPLVPRSYHRNKCNGYVVKFDNYAEMKKLVKCENLKGQGHNLNYTVPTRQYMCELSTHVCLRKYEDDTFFYAAKKRKNDDDCLDCADINHHLVKSLQFP